MKREGRVYTIIFTFIISFVFVFVLAVANELTKDTVERNQELFQIKAILSAMGISYQSDEEAFQKYNSMVSTESIDGSQLYTAEVNGQNVYATIFTGGGLWGTITGVLAVNEDVSRIVGIDFISQNETPGLGGRIEEDWFKKQFSGLKIIDSQIRVVTGQGTGDNDYENGQVDAITGATRTSESIERIVNETISNLKDILGVSI
ncbi:FMN-binding protein [Petrotoga olearia]|uniref:FMN-binding protein n=2 Tax=Petrotoga olearia TaxID=156203 RepID=A0A2K1NWP6_9BACT|nr:FMN-binding protein [Petrotoga olearia]KUK15568.1 MAG: FMN-binding domain protein [Petrotoga mobilis]PNR94956.1 FMN-binding protein [Petrotoga olearia DSM 13574]RMA73258.1 Na+-transporting NADH:ubiquinone oxidoreductase subunit C [Petrotoga olearia]HBT51138.1 FMN-binding protein [Petrotoga sp.]